jgi:hypothetical protein
LGGCAVVAALKKPEALLIDEVVTNDRKLRPQVVASRSLIGYRQSHERCSLPSVPETLLQRFSADCSEFA